METNKPEKHFKFGGVRATVWCDVRKSAGGKSFKSRSVTLDRAYKDADGEWKNTHSLKEGDILKAMTALQQAFEFMTQKSDGEDEE